MLPENPVSAVNVAYFSAFAALAGSAIGALSGIVTTWLTLNAQERERRFSEVMSRKEGLYGEFIDEAAKLLTDAITHKLDDASKFVRIYAVISKLRLFAPADVILAADQVMTRIIETYQAPVLDLNEMVKQRDPRDLDIVRVFSEACRRDLGSLSQFSRGLAASTMATPQTSYQDSDI